MHNFDYFNLCGAVDPPVESIRVGSSRSDAARSDILARVKLYLTLTQHGAIEYAEWLRAEPGFKFFSTDMILLWRSGELEIPGWHCPLCGKLLANSVGEVFSPTIGHDHCSLKPETAGLFNQIRQYHSGKIAQGIFNWIQSNGGLQR
jgi:hypothetical protein